MSQGTHIFWEKGREGKGRERREAIEKASCYVQHALGEKEEVNERYHNIGLRGENSRREGREGGTGREGKRGRREGGEGKRERREGGEGKRGREVNEKTSCTKREWEGGIVEGREGGEWKGMIL